MNEQRQKERDTQTEESRNAGILDKQDRNNTAKKQRKEHMQQEKQKQ